jgi:Uma2 family endonuclease
MRFREADIRIARSLLAVYKPAAMANALAQSEQLISVEDYLEGEKHSEIKHEYVSGYVYAMAGASDDHNRIVGNLFAALHACLRGKRCEPFGSDMKLKLADSQVFYYPDLMVTCDTADNAKYFRERPTILFEVLSPETERIDQREKVFAYGQIECLKAYVMVCQGKPELTILRRASPGPWSAQIVSGLKSILELPEIKVELPLARIYERTRLVRQKT